MLNATYLNEEVPFLGEIIAYPCTLTHVDEEEMNRAYKKILTKVYQQVDE